MPNHSSEKNTWKLLKKAASFIAKNRRLIHLAGTIVLICFAGYYYWQYEALIQKRTGERVENAKMITDYIRNEGMRIMGAGKFQNVEGAFGKIVKMAREKGVFVQIYRSDGFEAFSDGQTANHVLSLAKEAVESGEAAIAGIPVSELIAAAEKVLERNRPEKSVSIFEDPEQSHDTEWFDEALAKGEVLDTSHPYLIEKFIKINREECGDACHAGENAVVKMVIDKEVIKQNLTSELGWGIARVAVFVCLILLVIWLFGKLDEINREEREQEREKLKLQLEESNKSLMLLDEVKNRIANSSSFSEALVKSIELILEKLHWGAGHAYLLKDNAETISPSNQWCLKKEDEAEFEALKKITAKTEFKIGEGIIGRAVESKSSECIPNIKNADRKLFRRILEGAPTKIKGAWAFPILTEDGKVVAAFELYSFEEKVPNDSTITMMEFIGSQLGAAFERKQTETNMENLLHDINDRNVELEANAKKLSMAKERVEKALLQKNKLVSLVSHDLRSPLSTIINFADILLLSLKSKASEDEQKLMVERIAACCIGQLEMIDELLDISRLQNRGFDPNYTEEKAWFLAINAKEHLSPLADKKGVKLSVDISHELMITVDQFLFEGVLKNLISNAIKFCEKGDEISVCQLPDRPVTIVVSDTGMGIEKDRLPGLFDYEGGSTSSTTGTAGEKGTGLGLPLCRDIMEAHEGSIAVESVPGKGTKFFLHIPEKSVTSDE